MDSCVSRRIIIERSICSEFVRAQQQRNSEAENIFQRVIKTKPDYASAHIDLGLLYIQMGEAEKAIAQLEEGLRLAPDRADATAALAGVLRDQARSASGEDPEKALSFLLRARKLAPNDPDVTFRSGMVELRMSLFPDAVDAFQQTLKVHSDNAPATYGLGRALMELAKFQDAHEQFVRYVAIASGRCFGSLCARHEQRGTATRPGSEQRVSEINCPSAGADRIIFSAGLLAS